MASTNGKKPQAKSKSTKSARKVTAEASQPAVRKTAAAKPVPMPPPPEPAPKAPAPVPSPRARVTDSAPKTAPVLLNAVKADERLVEAAFVERAVDSLEKSFKAALPAAAAVNSKLVDIAQANMNSGMEFARDLAGAKSPMEMVRLGMTYWHENMGVFQAQAQELRTLSASFVTKASEPIRDHIRRA